MGGIAELATRQFFSYPPPWCGGRRWLAASRASGCVLHRPGQTRVPERIPGLRAPPAGGRTALTTFERLLARGRVRYGVDDAGSPGWGC